MVMWHRCGHREIFGKKEKGELIALPFVLTTASSIEVQFDVVIVLVLHFK